MQRIRGSTRMRYINLLLLTYLLTLTQVSRSWYTYKWNTLQMVQEFSIVQSTVVDRWGLYRNRAKKIGVVAAFFFAKTAGRCFTPVTEIKPNTFTPH